MKTCFYLIILSSILLVQESLQSMHRRNREEISIRADEAYSQQISRYADGVYKAGSDAGTTCCIIAPLASTCLIGLGGIAYKIDPIGCKNCVDSGCSSNICCSSATTCLTLTAGLLCCGTICAQGIQHINKQVK